MVFAHYRQLVTETQAKEWFSILPPEMAENILPLSEGFSSDCSPSVAEDGQNMAAGSD